MVFAPRSLGRVAVVQDNAWGRRLVGSKWVFKIKNSGKFRARLVALGYSQIPDVDYTENFAPVINDVTLRIVLVMGIIKKWRRVNVDVETAFLEGDLEHTIFMKLPPGYKDIFTDLIEIMGSEGREYQIILDNLDGDSVGELGKSIYGLVQAARQWYKKIA